MVDRFLAWLRSLPAKFNNWWERFTARQKMAIIFISIATLVAIGILVAVLAKPKYVTIYTASSPSESQSVIDILDSNSIGYKLSDDALTISINEKDYTSATLALGSNSIYVDTFSIDNVTSGGFSTTEADKQKRYVVYLEGLTKSTLETYSFVKNATVMLNIPEDDGTLIAKNTESSASIILDLSGECTTDTAAAMARFVATALGNESTKNVVILDTDGHLLYSGEDDNSTYGNASSQLALMQQVSEAVKREVRNVLTATNEFSTVEVAANIVLDNSYTERSEHLYWPDEGKDQGVLASADTYNAQNEGGVSGEPGTDSNTETTYVYENGEYSTSVVSETSYDYLPNESTTMQQIPAGAIKYNESSLTVTCLKYNVISEDEIKRQGLLDGITWDDYKANNNQRTKIEIDQELYSAVSTATGIATGDITIIGYEELLFIDAEGFSVEAKDIIQIILIILILGLLAFVVLRSMKTVRQEEEEPEISIDEILKSNPPEEFEEIGVEDKSEARKIVEKFVEDNPDAAANLLRNWLDEDWS